MKSTAVLSDSFQWAKGLIPILKHTVSSLWTIVDACQPLIRACPVSPIGSPFHGRQIRRTLFRLERLEENSESRIRPLAEKSKQGSTSRVHEKMEARSPRTISCPDETVPQSSSIASQGGHVSMVSQAKGTSLVALFAEAKLLQMRIQFQYSSSRTPSCERSRRKAPEGAQELYNGLHTSKKGGLSAGIRGLVRELPFNTNLGWD